MVYCTYHPPTTPASDYQHETTEVRVAHLARQLAELLEINATLRRQRDAAQAELHIVRQGVAL
jgi:hypothetical protein